MGASVSNLLRSPPRPNGKARTQRGSACLQPEQLAVGQVLSGRFRVERVIGLGSMGMVLAARHLDLGARVAIKAMLPEMLALPRMRALFALEARAAVGLRSEHIAQVFDIGADEALGPYIVMEHLEGQDLRALLQRQPRVPLARAVDYVLQACEALAVAHARGVIHRDIKPENLFLTRQGDLEIIKLLDFGVSKAALAQQLSEEPAARALLADEPAGLMGTPPYMSPEQIESREQVDQRADIWALGAVLFELVTGHGVFTRERSAMAGAAPALEQLPALLEHICQGEPAQLSDYCSGPECQLQGVIEQCLDKRPARRFQNVAELAYALFPFAPAHARVHAQRAAAILGSSVTGGLALPSLLADSLGAGSPRTDHWRTGSSKTEPGIPPLGPFRDNASGTRLRPPSPASDTQPDWTPPRSLGGGLGRAQRSLLVGALALSAALLGVLVLALCMLPREQLASAAQVGPAADLPLPQPSPR